MNAHDTAIAFISRFNSESGSAPMTHLQHGNDIAGIKQMSRFWMILPDMPATRMIGVFFAIVFVVFCS